MDSSTLIGFAAALRMTYAAKSDVARPPLVVCSDSDKARGLAGVPKDISAHLHLPALLHFPAAATGEEIAASILKSAGSLPALVSIDSSALFAVGKSKQEADAILDSLLEGKKLNPAAKAAAHAGRLHNKIVIVTGSAQGFGRGIAEEIAKEGAYIVVADLNDPVGQAFTAELNEKHGAGTALYCHVDVTNTESLDAMISETVKAYGGLDIFVSNAGILKAGAIHEMDEKSFDLVTSVNYKAFFLGVKSAMAVMKTQHALNPGYAMDIIQINSKSGLEGSNKNFAYAGSKFGSIGLTQSFALELAEYNIKVNAICPGNYYEGPLWSDPEKGLFVQYLRTGKVPGAKTIDDVRNFYMSKVPMKRGCSPLDVTRAILYLHEQEYETGQALPVTGGQVMLN
jgi:NAD(P)-dependent dehydrogenase (short-subunit alcohol dehydrogenase family)